MGFPLDRGSVRDGMLTCHWHQARFDLRSGCTFDLWADDVPRYESWIDDGVVYVQSEPSVKFDVAHHRARLQRGMEQNIGLVQAKSILALLVGRCVGSAYRAQCDRFRLHESHRSYRRPDSPRMCRAAVSELIERNRVSRPVLRRASNRERSEQFAAAARPRTVVGASRSRHAEIVVAAMGADAASRRSRAHGVDRLAGTVAAVKTRS